MKNFTLSEDTCKQFAVKYIKAQQMLCLIHLVTLLLIHSSYQLACSKWHHSLHKRKFDADAVTG
jgi:hypothetical protein